MYESQLSTPLAWFYVQNNIISINIAALLYKAYVVLHSLLSEIDGTLRMLERRRDPLMRFVPKLLYFILLHTTYLHIFTRGHFLVLFTWV